MLTALTDLLVTASSIGLVAIAAGVGIAVLPWRSSEARESTDALDAAAHLPVALVRVALAPAATPAPAISR